MKRCILLIIDSLGVGEAPDAQEYNNLGTNTLGNVAIANNGIYLPTFEFLGFGKITNVKGMKNTFNSTVGRLSEVSKGNDSTTGHWEIGGLITEKEFGIFPNGFPTELIEKIEKEANCKFIGNKHASGTEILEELGEHHLQTGDLILYTSGDSVFQIAAHNEICSIEDLYAICSIARKYCDEYNIGRVIARPFIGNLHNFTRTYDRKDFGIQPPGDTILKLLHENNFSTYGIGKIMDLFGTEFLTNHIHTEGDEHGLKILFNEIKNGDNQFIFVNLVDLDMLYGHREDPSGYYEGLKIIDKYLKKIIESLENDDLLIISGDHGTDPTDGSTDHSREYVPLIAYKKNSKKTYLGDLTGFYNIGKTIADYFNIKNQLPGESFLKDI